ncbi:MAG TPA: MDR family MFS transporter [Candidatus Limnocylindria bacterium]|nr:MDR family MFS transporter [Candidatus Limnocylindria bacterium]
MPPTTEAAAQPAVQIDHRARTEILIGILLALFLSALDQTIVGTAMPRIITDLRGIDLYTWVVTVYLLTSTITGPIYGKLSDQFGRKNLLIFGVGLFLLGSALSGLSGDIYQLILFRGIQGLGAGAIFPIALAVIGDLFTPRERGRYQGLFGAVFGISALIGPALGGFLTDSISWHWVFYVNLPIGAIALFIIWRLLPPLHTAGVSRKIDYLGVAVFTAALVPILIGLTNAQQHEWTDPLVGGLILLGLALGGLFLWIETRATEPIVPLGLFRNRTYAVSIVATFLASFGFFGAVLFLPLWYQVVNGSTATASGYQLLPLLAGLIISSIASGQIVSRTGRYKWLTIGSLVVLSIGLLLLTNLRAETSPPMLWLWQFITGLGVGPTFAVFTIIVQNAVPWNQLGVATSNLTFFRQIGGTVGLSLAWTIFGSTLRTEAPLQVTGRLTDAGAPQQVIAGFATNFHASDQLNQFGVGDMGTRILASVPEQFRALIAPFIQDIVTGIHQALSLAIANSMWLGVGAAIVATLVALLMPELPLRRDHNPDSAALKSAPVGDPAPPEA